MKTIISKRGIGPLGRVCLVALPMVCLSQLFAQDATNAPSATNYDTLISEGNQFLKAGKLKEGYQDSLAAAAQDPKRFEAYALAAFILHRQGSLSKAKDILDEALSRAPADKRQALLQFQKRLVADIGFATQTAATPAKVSAGAELTGEPRRKYEALIQIVDEADKAKSAEERKKLLREFMAKSAEFLELAPTQTNIWVVRGAAAMELDYPGAGWLAGRKLKEMGLPESNDAAMRKLMAMLEQKGWLGKDILLRDWSKWTVAQVKATAIEGDTEAQAALGSWYKNGTSGLAKDDAEAVRWYRKAAEQGDFLAQFNLGTMCEDGRGVAKDPAEALKWYRKAAEQGFDRAQVVLGLEQEIGLGVAKDEAEAAKWFRKAAEQGNAIAQGHLGGMYDDGRGVTKDEAEALKWYRKGVEQGDARAQYSLGRMYDDGRGVAKDEAEAVKWYRKGAEQGDARAQYSLGRMYGTGRGVAKDEAEAAKWHRKAAEQGHARAQAMLGLDYEYGLGVAKDEAEAVKWFRKAADQGLEAAKKELAELEAKK